MARLLSTRASSAHYDLAVVGLGAMGAATAWQAAERGLRVLGLDRFAPPHTHGSTHAETRITRLAVGEGPQYLPFVARTHELWRELEQRTGVSPLLIETGGYIICPRQQQQQGDESGAEERWFDFVCATEQVAREAGVEFHRRTPAEVRVAHPQLLLRDDEAVGFEPRGSRSCPGRRPSSSPWPLGPWLSCACAQAAS